MTFLLNLVGKLPGVWTWIKTNKTVVIVLLALVLGFIAGTVAHKAPKPTVVQGKDVVVYKEQDSKETLSRVQSLQQKVAELTKTVNSDQETIRSLNKQVFTKKVTVKQKDGSETTTEETSTRVSNTTTSDNKSNSSTNSKTTENNSNNSNTDIKESKAVSSSESKEYKATLQKDWIVGGGVRVGLPKFGIHPEVEVGYRLFKTPFFVKVGGSTDWSFDAALLVEF